MDDLIYGLTIRAPWIEAIMYGDKRVENRKQRPAQAAIGTWVALHASKTVDERAVEMLQEKEMFDFDALDDGLHQPGAIYGVAKLVGYAVSDYDYYDDKTYFCASGGRVNGFWDKEFSRDRGLIPYVEVQNNEWRDESPVGWMLEDVHPFDEYIAATGMPGWWKLEGQSGLKKKVLAQMEKLEL